MDSDLPLPDTEPHLRKFQKELAAGTVALVLLSVLGRSQRPLYGYEIAKQLEREAAAPVAGKQSALYPVLRNLHAAGLLDSHVEPSVAGPPRRYYNATALGRAVLAEWMQAWHSTRAFVDDALAG
jgi:PadR family transcriptional regulator PadR